MDTNRLLANARVTLEGKFNTIEQNTNEKGEVNFTSVPPDTYTVLVQKEGYKDYLLPSPIIIKKGKNNNHQQKIKLEKIQPKASQKDIDTRTLIIKTRQQGAKVQLTNYENKSTINITTNKRGNAVFEEVPFGNYEILIQLEGYEEYSRDILVNSNNRLVREIPCKLEQSISMR